MKAETHVRLCLLGAVVGLAILVGQSFAQSATGSSASSSSASAASSSSSSSGYVPKKRGRGMPSNAPGYTGGSVVIGDKTASELQQSVLQRQMDLALNRGDISPADYSRGEKEAPALIAQGKLPCGKMTRARWAGKASKSQDGKTVDGDAYEVACDNGRGFYLTRFADGTMGTPLDCNHALALNAQNKANPGCALTENLKTWVWLQPFVRTKTSACNVVASRWIAPNSQNDKVFYEVACNDSPTGINAQFDFSAIYAIPDYDATDQTVGFTNCIKTEGTSLACDFVPHDRAIKYLEPKARKAKADCVVANARFIGGKGADDYYEIGCSSGFAFILVLDADDQPEAAIGCDKAAAIGGCKFVTPPKS